MERRWTERRQSKELLSGSPKGGEKKRKQLLGRRRRPGESRMRTSGACSSRNCSGLRSDGLQKRKHGNRRRAAYWKIAGNGSVEASSNVHVRSLTTQTCAGSATPLGECNGLVRITD